MAYKFNERQMKYKANRIKGMNQYNSARAAGYSESTSRNHNHELERVTKCDIRDALEQAGLTPTYRAKELAKLTQAKKPKGLGLAMTEDNAIRLNAHRHITEICGDVKNKIEHTGISSETKIIIIRGDIGTESKTPAVSGQVRI